ncbi:sporulation integral membrane protein YlbJ [Hathewaya histolytica]|uniref:Membrane protein n=1 Tax=Hathewaya histolytica TaxID=1498 RepID=A0A4U9RMI0_HATHI|nr:sporulation integral membrane protein YlbJ [Hathewaya histolytica]VTQ90070.1 membrane protein [Hathewaya histolytica]
MHYSSKRNNKIFILILSFLILNIIIFPKPCMDGSLKGLKLFIQAVFPCLFPFLVLCNLIIAFNGIELYAKLLGPILCKPLNLPTSCSVVILLSFLCGYPMGAKYTSDLYEKKIIDFNTAEKLLNIASNASPLFIMGTISMAMLNNKRLGYILLISNYISCILMGIILKTKNNLDIKNKTKFKHNFQTPTFSKAFSSSIEDALNISILVGGFVIFFSMITEIIRSNTILSIAPHLKNKTLFSFLLGLLEITNGCHSISSMVIPTELKLILISFLISFSGLCIILQVYAFLYKYNFSIKKYVRRKFLQGILAAVISLGLYTISTNSRFSFAQYSSNNYNINFSIYIIIVSLILLIPLVYTKIKKLFNIL